MKSAIVRVALAALLITGCAGFERDCNSSCAQNLGSDWIIVQYRMDGSPINCWKLKGTAVSNEGHSDGIYWQDPQGHLVHVSGHYNRVQVSSNRWEEAAATIGVNESQCKNGVYKVTEHDAGK